MLKRMFVAEMGFGRRVREIPPKPRRSIHASAHGSCACASTRNGIGAQ
jgi:hypothetical protein